MPDPANPPVSRKTSFDIVTTRFRRFTRMQAAGGIVLLISACIALLWANSRWVQNYDVLWHTPLTISLGTHAITETRYEWINDGLMSIFFFLVGLEIKREVLVGELSDLKQGAFTLIAAVGGTTVPALIYLSVTHGNSAQQGWGIPMATDIAFALGVLTLLGDRVPVTLRVFVTSLAIVDDIIAVLVIAVFYTAHISFGTLGIAAGGLAVCCLANWQGVRHPAFYAVIGFFVWLAVLDSGVHATLAGVLLAFTIPAKTRINRSEFLQRSHSLLDKMRSSEEHSSEEEDAVNALERQCELVQSPLHRIEHRLQPWVSLLIIPLFAFANAGVSFVGNGRVASTHPIALGVALGLFLGKPLGITAFSWLAARLKLASRPEGTSWTQIFGASWLCGIGFTMSLFIASLAFGEGPSLEIAKVGTISASVLAGLFGVAMLRRPITDSNCG